jgi:hypothetical protein
MKLRVLSRNQFKQFETMATSLGVQARKFLISQAGNSGLGSQCSDLWNLMFQAVRMLGVSNAFPDILLAVTAFQGSYIDLQAFLDYEEYYKPRLSAPELLTIDVDKSLMGGITESEVEASNLFIMGVPFWLIRPAHNVCTSPDTLVGMEVTFEAPSSKIILDQFDPPFPPVFQGYPHRDMQRATQRIRCSISNHNPSGVSSNSFTYRYDCNVFHSLAIPDTRQMSPMWFLPSQDHHRLLCPDPRSPQMPTGRVTLKVIVHPRSITNVDPLNSLDHIRNPLSCLPKHLLLLHSTCPNFLHPNTITSLVWSTRGRRLSPPLCIPPTILNVSRMAFRTFCPTQSYSPLTSTAWCTNLLGLP